MRYELELIADQVYIETLARDPSIKTAQSVIGGAADAIIGGVVSFVKEQWDPNRPVESVANFLVPGLLWATGLRWIGVAYTVAEALGMDMKGFWTKIKDGIMSLVSGIFTAKKADPSYHMSEEEASGKIKSVVSNAMEGSATGKEDKQKLEELAKEHSFKNDVNDALEVKAFALRLQKNPLASSIIKEAQFMSKIVGFFIRLISFLIRKAFVSLGIISVIGGATGLLGLQKKPEASPGEPGQAQSESTQQPKTTYKMSPNIPHELFDVHRNEPGSVWIEKGRIDNIESILTNWVVSAYPDVNPDKLKDAPSFQAMVSKFNSRNSLAHGIDILAVPKPFERKIDIVFSIVQGL